MFRFELVPARFLSTNEQKKREKTKKDKKQQDKVEAASSSVLQEVWCRNRFAPKAIGFANVRPTGPWFRNFRSEGGLASEPPFPGPIRKAFGFGTLSSGGPWLWRHPFRKRWRVGAICFKGPWFQAWCQTHVPQALVIWQAPDIYVYIYGLGWTRAYPCSEHGRTEPGVQSDSRPEHSVFESFFRTCLCPSKL